MRKDAFRHAQDAVDIAPRLLQMGDNWGHKELHVAIEQRTIVEMKHAAQLISRIIFPEGTPDVSRMTTITIDAEMPRQHANDLAAEHHAVRGNNVRIQWARELGDNGSWGCAMKSSKRNKGTGNVARRRSSK